MQTNHRPCVLPIICMATINYNQERDELHLTGILKDKEELLKELRNYLRQVFVISPKAEFNRSEISKIEEIPFDMQTLLLCE